jgi:hypothetical protein
MKPSTRFTHTSSVVEYPKGRKKDPSSEQNCDPSLTSHIHGSLELWNYDSENFEKGDHS